MGNKGRVGYPSDVSDEEWAFVVPYLVLCREDAPQREYSLRAVFNGLRYLVRTGCQWRYLPHDLPPWPVEGAPVQQHRGRLRLAPTELAQQQAQILDHRLSFVRL